MNEREITAALAELETLTTKELKYQFKLFNGIPWKKHPIDQRFFDAIVQLLAQREDKVRFTV
jgi:hypothetical protein